MIKKNCRCGWWCYREGDDRRRDWVRGKGQLKRWSAGKIYFPSLHFRFIIDSYLIQVSTAVKSILIGTGCLIIVARSAITTIWSNRGRNMEHPVYVIQRRFVSINMVMSLECFIVRGHIINICASFFRYFAVMYIWLQTEVAKIVNVQHLTGRTPMILLKINLVDIFEAYNEWLHYICLGRLGFFHFSNPW